MPVVCLPSKQHDSSSLYLSSYSNELWHVKKAMYVLAACACLLPSLQAASMLQRSCHLQEEDQNWDGPGRKELRVYL